MISSVKIVFVDAAGKASERVKVFEDCVEVFFFLFSVLPRFPKECEEISRLKKKKKMLLDLTYWFNLLWICHAAAAATRQPSDEIVIC